MLYKNISFTKDVVKPTAKKNAGKTYFRAEFINTTDPFDMHVIKVNFFPETDAHVAMLQEWADGGKVPNINYGKFTVALEPFRLMDTDTGVMRPDVLTSMDIHVRLVPNPLYVKDKTPELIPAVSPEKLAKQTVENLGEWVATGSAKNIVADEKADDVPPAIIDDEMPPVPPTGE